MRWSNGSVTLGSFGLPRFFDQVLYNPSGMVSLSSEGLGRQVSEGAVRSLGARLGLPLPESLGGITERQEPGRIKALRSQPSVEAFDVSVISGFAGARE